MGCATSVVKLVVFAFNFLFALSGLALVAVGALVLRDVSALSEQLSGKFAAPPVLCIVVGSVIFVVAFFGCCGALRESHCMLSTYVVLLLTIFVAQVVVCVLAFVYRDDTEDMMLDKIKKYVDDYPKYQKTMDSIQTNLRCCGAGGPADYLLSPGGLPASCCGGAQPCALLAVGSYYATGCQQALKDFVARRGALVGGACVGVAAVEIVGVLLGLCLANSIKNAERRRGG